VTARSRGLGHQVRGFPAYPQGWSSREESAFRTAIAAFRKRDRGESVLCLVLLATGRRQETLDCMAEQESLLKALAAGRLSALSARGCLALRAVRAGDVRRADGYYAAVPAWQASRAGS
jgi:hypothetical protein